MQASPAWGAKKLTVPRLKDWLLPVDQSNWIGEEVATGLKQIGLSEERICSTITRRIVSFAGKWGMDSFQGLNSQRLNPP